MVLFVKFLLYFLNFFLEFLVVFNCECVMFFFFSFCIFWSNLVVLLWEVLEVDVWFDGMIFYNVRVKKMGEDGFSFGCVRISVVN